MDSYAPCALYPSCIKLKQLFNTGKHNMFFTFIFTTKIQTNPSMILHCTSPISKYLSHQLQQCTGLEQKIQMMLLHMNNKLSGWLKSCIKIWTHCLTCYHKCQIISQLLRPAQWLHNDIYHHLAGMAGSQLLSSMRNLAWWMTSHPGY